MVHNIYMVISQSTTQEIDETVIIRLENKLYKGNLFIDVEEGNFAYCKFSSYFHPVDTSEYQSLDFFALMEIYEEEFLKDMGLPIALYASDEFLSIAENIINSIKNRPQVKKYCNRHLRELRKEPELDTIIELLNQLSIDSELTHPPEIEEVILRQDTRGLFRIGSKRSNKKDPIYRFALPMLILKQYMQDESKYIIKASLVGGNTSIRFQVLEGLNDKEIKYTDSREMVLNSGCWKVKLPKDTLNRLSKPDKNYQLFIRRQGKTIHFDLC